MIPVNTVATSIAVQAAARHKKLLARLRELPRGEATRARVLAGQEDLAPVLDELVRKGVVHRRSDGVLRYDESAMHAQQSAQGKVALLVVLCVVAVAAAAAATLVLVR